MNRRFARSTLILSALACATAATAATVATTDDAPVESRVFEALAAEPFECPGAVSSMDDGEDAACARTGLTWRKLKKKLGRFVGALDSSDLSKHAAWYREDGRHVRWLLPAKSTPRKVLFDEVSGWIAIFPTHPCFGKRRLSDLGVVAPEELDRLPEILHKTRAEFPEEARARREEGQVLVEAILDHDGTVADLCIIEEVPEGVRLAEAAARAIVEWRYTPPEQEGKPVRTWLLTLFTWTYGGL